MSLVLDCSATIAFLLPDETTASSQSLLATIVAAGAVVPGHWRLEVANALTSAIRRRRITQIFRDGSLADLLLLPIQTDPQTADAAWSKSLALADRHALTIYDAAYLELALRRHLPLATLDATLKTAATTAGIQVLVP